MATRKITLKNINEETGDVTFAVTDSTYNPSNTTFVVNGLPTDTTENFLAAARAHLRAYRLGGGGRAKASTEVKAIVNVAQDLPETGV